MQERETDYTPDEKRVCNHIQEIMPEIGCGFDPIGFLIASHKTLIFENKKLRSIVESLRND